MDEQKKIEKILSNWIEQAKANTVFKKDATIDYEKNIVHLTIVPFSSNVGVFADCEANEKVVLQAIDKLEELKEQIK